MLTHQRITATGHFVLGERRLPPDRDISVEIEQLGSGSTFLYTGHENDAAVLIWIFDQRAEMSFVGHTIEGLPVRTSNMRAYVGPKADQRCVSLSRVTIGAPDAASGLVELAITNLVFEQDQDTGQSFSIPVDHRSVALELVPTEGYADALFHLQQTSDPTVTAKLTITMSDGLLDALDPVVDDLCLALSVVQGRKVQWIDKTAYASDGRIAWKEFGETITKNYTHGLLCFDPDKGTGITVPLHKLPSAFSAVRRFRQGYDPPSRVIKAWLDARLQDDFLEARTLKYVIVLEALCRLVEAKHGEIRSSYLPTSAWRAAGKEFLPQIQDRLGCSRQVDSGAIDNVCSSANWGNLNRAGFRTILADCLRALGISTYLDAERIRRVTDIRNRIVHSFRHLTEDDFAKLKWPVATAVEQHCLVASFVDEVLLHLFGLRDQVAGTREDGEKLP